MGMHVQIYLICHIKPSLFTFVSVSLFAFYVLETANEKPANCSQSLRYKKGHVIPDGFRRTETQSRGFIYRKTCPYRSFCCAFVSNTVSCLGLQRKTDNKELHLDCHLLDFLILDRTILTACFGGGDLVNHFHSFRHFTEGCILSVKMRRVLMHDEELASG